GVSRAPAGVYAPRDGHLAISRSPLTARGEALAEPQLAAYSEREAWTKQDEIGALIGARLATAATAHWVARMEPLKIWHAAVQGYAEVVGDPQARHMRSLMPFKRARPTGAPPT